MFLPMYCKVDLSTFCQWCYQGKNIQFFTILGLDLFYRAKNLFKMNKKNKRVYFSSKYNFKMKMNEMKILD